MTISITFRNRLLEFIHKKGKFYTMSETIAAIATSSSKSAISVIRISGENAIIIADAVFKGISGKSLSAHPGFIARLGRIYDAKGEIDEVIATIYRAPKSYTGENTVEFSCHGGSYIARRVLEVVINAGARPALAGEFTKRAVLAGKMTLTQAEAINEMIFAQGENAHKAAIGQYDGALYRRINCVKTKLVETTAKIAAELEFPEDDIEQTASVQITKELSIIQKELQDTINSYAQGKIIREGISTVIAGKPNVGKSTLMNLLSKSNKSIVTEYAGTTRDIIEETIDVGGVCLNIADTAGLHQTQDNIEKIGVDLAQKRLEISQLVLAVFDISNPFNDDDYEIIKKLDKQNTLVILNKSDLPQKAVLTEITAKFDYIIKISAKLESNPKEIYDKINEITAKFNFDPTSGMIFSIRQLDCAKRAESALQQAILANKNNMNDAAAVCTENAIDALMELTGEKITETLLEEIFSKFCIGK